LHDDNVFKSDTKFPIFIVSWFCVDCTCRLRDLSPIRSEETDHWKASCLLSARCRYRRSVRLSPVVLRGHSKSARFRGQYHGLKASMTTTTLPKIQDIPVVWTAGEYQTKEVKEEFSPSPSFHKACLANGSLTIVEFSPPSMTRYLQQVPWIA